MLGAKACVSDKLGQVLHTCNRKIFIFTNPNPRKNSQSFNQITDSCTCSHTYDRTGSNN